MEGITYIGKTNFRGEGKAFGIKDEDRLGHIYCIGKTGVGKSTLLKNMTISDIIRGNGLCVIDPHSDIAQDLLKYIPEHRVKDLIYFNPLDTKNPRSFNPLHAVHPQYHCLVASGLVSTFKRIWEDSWGPRMERLLRFSLLTLLCYPPATLLDIQPLLTDKEFRKQVLSYIENTDILSFWIKEFNTYAPKFHAVVTSPVLNKTGIFSASTPLKNVIGKQTTSFRMQQIIDGQKILICNLSKGLIGEEATSILGSVLVTSIQLAALYRARQPEEKRIPFYLYVDECHSFISLPFADILAEARKYKLGSFLAHQYTDQLNEKVRAAVFGNVGTVISFRVGATDAGVLAKEFYPVFNEQDLIHLPRYSMYLKLMIDGATSQPFSANSLHLNLM